MGYILGRTRRAKQVSSVRLNDSSCRYAPESKGMGPCWLSLSYWEGVGRCNSLTVMMGTHDRLAVWLWITLWNTKSHAVFTGSCWRSMIRMVKWTGFGSVKENHLPVFIFITENNTILFFNYSWTKIPCRVAYCRQFGQNFVDFFLSKKGNWLKQTIRYY